MQSRPSPVRFGRAAGRTQGGSPHRNYRTDPLKSNRQWSQVSWPVSILALCRAAGAGVVHLSYAQVVGEPRSRRPCYRSLHRTADFGSLRSTSDQGAVSTGPDGTARIELPNDSSAVTIQAPGYEAITTTLSRNGSAHWQVALRPNVLRGRLVDEKPRPESQPPRSYVIAPDKTEQTTTTDADGRYLFDSVPEGATIRFSSADYGISRGAGRRENRDQSHNAPVIRHGNRH